MDVLKGSIPLNHLKVNMTNELLALRVLLRTGPNHKMLQ